MPPHAFPGRATRGPRRGPLRQAPTVKTWVSGGAPATRPRPSAQTRRRYVAARANLLLYRETRIFLLYPAVHLPRFSLRVATASRRWPWRAATSTWPKHIFRDRTRPHLACFAPRSKLKSRKVGERTQLSRSENTRARHLHFLVPVPNCHSEFLTFSHSSAPFSPACSPPPSCFFA
jgi:hypothetical protein